MFLHVGIGPGALSVCLQVILTTHDVPLEMHILYELHNKCLQSNITTVALWIILLALKWQSAWLINLINASLRWCRGLLLCHTLAKKNFIHTHEKTRKLNRSVTEDPANETLFIKVIPFSCKYTLIECKCSQFKISSSISRISFNSFVSLAFSSSLGEFTKTV